MTTIEYVTKETLMAKLQTLLTTLKNFVAMKAEMLTSLAGKVDKVTGKGLSTNDLTDEMVVKIGKIDGLVANSRTESGMVVGQWAEITSSTVFAIGNGTSDIARNNIFEVRDNNNGTELIIRSPDGSKFKLTVSDTGQLTATKI